MNLYILLLDQDTIAAQCSDTVFKMSSRSSRTVRAGNTLWRFTSGGPSATVKPTSASMTQPPLPTDDDNAAGDEAEEADHDDEETPSTEEEQDANEELAADAFSQPVWQGLGQITNLLIRLLDTHQRHCNRELQKQVHMLQRKKSKRVSSPKHHPIVEQMLREIALEDQATTSDSVEPHEEEEPLTDSPI